MKKILVLLLSATTVFSLVACGKNASATSEVSNTTNETVAEKTNEAEVKLPTTEESQLNNEANEGETEDQEPEESSSPEASTQVDFEDYFEGNTWNLTAYAEALGYEWIPDPEYDGLIMYAIENNGVKYFFCFRRNTYHVFYADADGKCWEIGGDETMDFEFRKYAISSNGQATEDTTMEMIERVSDVMSCLKYNDINGTPSFPGFYVLTLYDGSASYYENGMIKQRDFGNIVETTTSNNL